MSFDQAKRGVHVSNGPGIVASLKGFTAYAAGDEVLLNALIVRLNALSDEPWQEVVRALTTEITAVGYDQHPSLACVVVEDDRVAAFVFGDTTLSIVIDGSETLLNGNDSSTWIDVTLHGGIERVLAGTQSDSPIVGVLRDGAIPAGGFMLDTHGPMPASGRWTNETQRTVDSTDDAPEAVEEPSIEEEMPITEEATVDDSAPAPAQLAEDAPSSSPQPAHSNAGGMFARIDERTSSNDLEEFSTAEVDAVPELSPEPVEQVEQDVSLDSAPAWEQVSPLEADPESVFADPDDEMPNATDEPIDAEFAIGQTEPNPISQPSAEHAAESAPAATATLTATRPTIRGVECSDGHLTNPRRSTCTTCGIPVAADAPEKQGVRPSLGTLTFDDGASLSIDRPAAIGADVAAGYSINDELATIVRLDDGIGGVDSLHMEVRLSGWNVEIVDMESAGGTYTLQGKERHTRTRLRSGQSVTLQPGMSVEAGGRSFTYTLGPTPISLSPTEH